MLDCFGAEVEVGGEGFEEEGHFGGVGAELVEEGGDGGGVWGGGGGGGGNGGFESLARGVEGAD